MWGSTFADLAKRATELQEQASQLATTKSLFNLDGLQHAKGEVEHVQSTAITDGATNLGDKESSVKDEPSAPTTTEILQADKNIVVPLVISNVPDTAEGKTGSSTSIDVGGNDLSASEAVLDVKPSSDSRDGWEDEEEDIEFDSSQHDNKHEHVFASEQLDSMLSPLDDSREEEIQASAPESNVAPNQESLPLGESTDEQEIGTTIPSSYKVEPTVRDATTTALEAVGEPDGDMVFNDDDDGLEDMYDDEDGEEKAEAPSEEKTIDSKQQQQPNTLAVEHSSPPEALTVEITPVVKEDEVDAELENNIAPPVEEFVSIQPVTEEEAPIVAVQDATEEKAPIVNFHDLGEAHASVDKGNIATHQLNESKSTLDTCTVDGNIAAEPTESSGAPTPSEAVSDNKRSHAEASEPTPLPVESPPSERTLPESTIDNSLADRLLEQFSQQMQRLDENHQAEMRERDHQHALELEKALASLNHDKCEEQRREMEERLLEKLREKDEQLMELLKTNEGHKLKIDVLKRELDGTRQLLAEKEIAVGSANVARQSEIKDLERKLKEKDNEIATAKTRYDKLSAELKDVKSELETTNDSFSTLKGRVKIVATELKDRRVECRNLGIEVAELTESNENLKKQVANLQSQLADQNRSQSEKDDELEQTRTKLAEMEERLKVAEKSVKEAGAVNERTLTAYKKKAQTALAEANARAAAASQAREEAELEARAARSTADSALERARIAEAAGKEALAEAKGYVSELELEKSQFEGEAKELKQSLNSTLEQLKQVRSELDDSRVAQDKLSRDLEQMCRNLEAERVKSHELEGDLADSRRRSNELHDQLETLREEMQRPTTTAFSVGQYSDTPSVGGKADNNGHLNLTSVANKSNEKSDAEATIIMLQQELHDANRAIRELKETLRVAIEQAENAQTSHVSVPTRKTNGFHGDGSVQGNDSTPLYFAMEKQAELNMARDEINRLANLLGDAESARMEAFEAMDEMRRKMEEAEARLRRFEKMGSAAGRAPHSRSSFNQALSPRDGNRIYGADESPLGHRAAHDETVVDSAVVNLEYLKNVMLSYLNAKTLQEKKALVPVIGAVLCLTAEEQAKAFKTIEESGGIEGVGQALLESFGSTRLFS